MKVQILDLANADLLEGYRFYERQTRGVGSYFVETLLSDIESLRLYTGTHRRVFGYHRLLSKRFPFAIYYAFDGELVRVLRVLDCRRDPTWIRRQFTGKRSKR